MSIATGAVAAVALPGGPTLPWNATATPDAGATPSGAPSASAGASATPEPTAPAAPGSRANSAFVPADARRNGIPERLQAALDQGRSALAAPGISAAVLFPDGSLWAGTAGVADLATARPLDVSTPFAVASISKTFLAAEILALVDDGRLGIDDPAVRYLPGMVVGSAPLDPRITIRQLLDHTSGLGDFLVSRELDRAVRADPTAVWTPARSLSYAGRPVGAPGAGYHYANTNYVLLGLIAEARSGATLADEYRRRFLGPLGLASAFYQGVEPPTGELPTSYRYRSASRSEVPTDVGDGTSVRPFTALTTAAGAAGSMAATPADLVRWARALYGGYVLSRESLAAMLDDAARVAQLTPAAPYGLGVQSYPIDGRPTYGHSGRLVGARSVVRWFPDAGIAIAVTTNESRFDPTIVLEHLLAIAAPASIGAGLSPG